MQTTRFPERASGPAERVAGFLAHLRHNGLTLGPGDGIAALGALAAVDATKPAAARLALKASLAGDRQSWERFDALFEAYWLHRGRPRPSRAADTASRHPSRPALWSRHADGNDDADRSGTADGADEDDGEAAPGEGRLRASRRDHVADRDLRNVVDPLTLDAAAAIAARLTAILRDRRSRRRFAARRGDALDLRTMARRSLAHGGEPIELWRRRRRDQPMRVVAILDVSGSMEAHARIFLAFLRGLVSAGGEAYVLHTRLARVSGALRERNPLRAAERLSLLAPGFGGGTRLAACLQTFNDGHAKAAIDRRTVVLVISDGYDTAAPERLGPEVARLRRRAARIVWLNPLLGWQEHAPVAAAMRAVLPHLDLLAPASTLAALAALEPLLERL